MSRGLFVISLNNLYAHGMSHSFARLHSHTNNDYDNPSILDVQVERSRFFDGMTAEKENPCLPIHPVNLTELKLLNG
jgi:hypothetical protein